MRRLLVRKNCAKRLELLVRQLYESKTKTERWRLVGHLAGQLEPLAIWQLNSKTQNLTYQGFAESIDVATALGKIRDTCAVVAALAVPDSIETNDPTLLSSALAHNRRPGKTV